MIAQLKDKDGNDIPLDTSCLYMDNGDVVEVIGYSYAIFFNTWVALTSRGEAICPLDFHLRRPSVDDVSSGFLRYMERRFCEIKERCE